MFAHQAVAASFDRVEIRGIVEGSFVLAPVTCATLPAVYETACWMRLRSTSC